MTDLHEPQEAARAKLSRRNVVVGTAWATPVVVAVGVAPAATASTSKAWTISALPSAWINISNAGSFTVTGTGAASTTFTLNVTGLGPTLVTVNSSGDWTTTLDLSGSGVPQGLITFQPTGFTFGPPATRTATKDTVRPTFTAIRNPDGINRTLHGVVSADATVTLTPARGTITYGAPSGGTRTWTTVKYKASDFVGAFTTVTVTAADAAGNASISPASVPLADA